MAKNADTQSNASNCRDSYQSGSTNSNGQSTSKNKASNKTSANATNVSGQDKTDAKNGQ